MRTLPRRVLRGLLACTSDSAPVCSDQPRAAAEPAQQPTATAIVYRCGNDFENLCRFTFDGARPKQLTSDGKPDGPLYTSPSLSADGTKMAFTFGNFAYTADGNAANKVQRSDRQVVLASLRPDGGKLATIELLLNRAVCPARCSRLARSARCAILAMGPRYGVYFFPLGFIPYLFTYNPDGTGKQTERRLPRTFNWWGNRILSDARYSTETKQLRRVRPRRGRLQVRARPGGGTETLAGESGDESGRQHCSRQRRAPRSTRSVNARLRCTRSPAASICAT